MPRIQTKFFGDRDCDSDSIYSFPSGLPGFEDQRSFCFLTIPESEPLMFMQSMSTRSLCFVLLPVLVADPDYRVALSAEERAILELPGDQPLRIGRDVLCAVTVCSEGGGVPTVNMMAPLVVNLKEKIGIQAIHLEAGYSHRHPLRLEEELVAC